MRKIAILISLIALLSLAVVFNINAQQNTITPMNLNPEKGTAVCGNGICEEGEDEMVIIGQTNSIPPSYIYGPKCSQDCPAKDLEPREPVCGNGVCEQGERYSVECSCPSSAGEQCLAPCQIKEGACPEDCPYKIDKCALIAVPSNCSCKDGIISCPSDDTIKVEINREEKQESVSISIRRDPEENKIKVRSDNLEAATSEKLIIENSKLYMEIKGEKAENKEIKVLPEEAAAKAEKIEKIDKVELNQEFQKPVYSVKGTRRAKLLFLIPINLNIETKIDAQTGEVISVKKPWWSFLAW